MVVFLFKILISSIYEKNILIIQSLDGYREITKFSVLTKDHSKTIKCTNIN